jgi:hypothetical protein
LNCGYTYYTKHDRMTLDEVNQLREDLEMEKIDKLEEWK